MPPTGIVVPCYNEASRLDRDHFLRFAALHPQIRFLFVNDGSSDGTHEVLEAMCSRRPQSMQVLDLQMNQGKAEAVRRGMLVMMDSGVEAAGFWDADLSTPLEEIPAFTQVLRERDDVGIVLGTRLSILGRRVERNWLRGRLGRLFAWCASWVIGLRVFDTQCGAKLLRVSAATRKLFQEPFISRWIFDVEMLVRWRLVSEATADESPHSMIYEMPLGAWREVKGSKLKSGDFVRAVGELWSIWRRYRGASYNASEFASPQGAPIPSTRRAA